LNKIIFIVFLVTSLFGDNYKKALEAYYKRDFNSTLKLLKPLIDNEDPRAQYQLGVMYRYGKGVKEDYQASRKLFKKAFITNQKIACGSYFLGMCQGKGNAEAQNDLGEAHLRHHWAERDEDKAADWFKKAAAQGHANAQFRLGSMYYSKDKSFVDKLAYKFIPNLFQPVPHSQSWPKSLPADAVSQDLDKALELFIKSTKQGHPGGQYMLANMYHQGDIVEKSNEKAYDLYKRSANQNFSPAQVQLVQFYLQGIGTKTNFAKAVYWYERALENKQYIYGKEYRLKRMKAELVPMQKLANEGNSKAQYEMGQMYHGNTLRYFDITRNPKRALLWYEKAIKNDYAPAQSAVGYMYCYGKEHGQWVKQDTEKSLYWYHKAAEQGYPEAFYKLHGVYLGYCEKNNKNSSFKVDLETANYWLKKANDAGYKND